MLRTQNTSDTCLAVSHEFPPQLHRSGPFLQSITVALEGGLRIGQEHAVLRLGSLIDKPELTVDDGDFLHSDERIFIRMNLLGRADCRSRPCLLRSLRLSGMDVIRMQPVNPEPLQADQLCSRCILNGTFSRHAASTELKIVSSRHRHEGTQGDVL